jgi:hypothetical protein
MTKIIKMKPLAQACAFILATGSLVSMNNAIAASAKAGSIISNKVTVTYQDANGKVFTNESNTIEISIREVRSATLTAGNGAEQKVLTSVKQVRSVHTLKNLGNVDEIYTLVAANATDDTIDATSMKIYLDKDGNGTLNAEELKASPITEIKLAMGESATFVIITDLPATKAGDKLHITLDAKDSKGTVAKTTNNVNITFQDAKDNIKEVVIMPPGKGSSCNAYAWIKEGETWNNANKNASSWIYKGKKGHLATMTTAEENAFVAAKINSNNGGEWWIGARRTINDKTFTKEWVTGEKFGYTNWNTNEPSNNDEKGLMFYDDGKWYDLNDATLRHYIVEFELGACPSTPKPQVEVNLKAAKSDCKSGKLLEGEKFTDLRLEDMAPGECVTMHMRAENTSETRAEAFTAKQELPAYLSYIPHTLAACGWDDNCKLTPRSDTYKTKDGKGDWAHFDSKTGTVVFGGLDGKKLAHINPGDVFHGQFRAKID